MRAAHRGHTIEATREPWSIFRDADGYECDSGFEDSDETEASMVAILCQRIDAELDPWLESEGS